MADKTKLGIIGCGDYVQRWEAGPISSCTTVQAKTLFDLNRQQAEKLQKKIGGDIAGSVEDILHDAVIDIVCVFVPPWVRADLISQTARAGKHIITTKPLAPSIDACETILNATQDIYCGVFYGRSGNPVAETLKDIFDSNEIGKLALYKQDWLHHYPTWHDWAIDPEKNGGPFMDAMIHNMNLAKFLMGRPIVKSTFFSDTHAHADLACADTEFMKLDFADNGAAHLFITWAADLEIFDNSGNDREHIDIFYMVTDQGWRVTLEEENGEPVIVASRKGEKKTWTPKPMHQTPYDAFAESVRSNQPLPRTIVRVEDAVEDIRLLLQD